MAQVKSTIRYCDLNREVSVEKPGLSILEYSIINKIPHLHECGGHGLCTTCRIRVIDGAENLSSPTKQEIETAKKRNWDPSIRLGCQTKLKHNQVALERLLWTSAEISNLQLETIPFGIGDELELAFLFCDMRNFTPLANQHSNFDLAHMLNRFFSTLGDPVFMNNGIIYQYAGDEIVALFGTDKCSKTKMCSNAARAALGMLYALERLNKWELKEFNANFEVGIGLHFGKAFVGNIGHSRHKQFAVIGDSVNVTSRIQGKNKELKTNLLASESFYKNLPEGIFDIGKISTEALKGKDELIAVYEILRYTNPDVSFGVQSTLNVLLKNEEHFATNFYAKVFERAPSVKKLFQENMTEQGKMLTHMLRGIIYGLSRPEHLKLGLRSLGEQHKLYGVKHEHYLLIKEIIYESIQEELGAAFTPDIAKAWDTALDIIIDAMDA
ncbi:adenylate/guanylate cyclase domain-containing protein [Chondrinema litorale]|uniref:adenylate/guanylate cyclase domain-containing protein n=1 Tax=Chondrinema litorale TaxID=2994555 RepID=UPI0025432A99|nr:adenylate/guanylate cyclase domain-containing protein [Chondrinema litorale]UZR97811.1 2Fe-2S iron-sulfur cluster-binding protein [Chondrinema litorale]